MDVYFGNSILEAKKCKIQDTFSYSFIFWKKHTHRWIKLLKDSTIRNCWKSARGLIKLHIKEFFFKSVDFKLIGKNSGTSIDCTFFQIFEIQQFLIVLFLAKLAHCASVFSKVWIASNGYWSNYRLFWLKYIKYFSAKNNLQKTKGLMIWWNKKLNLCFFYFHYLLI